MIVLAIDPGSDCGWAVRKDNAVLGSGTWGLKGGRHEGGGMRFLRLRAELNKVRDLVSERIDMAAYEEVRRHLGTDAAHVYGGVVATLTAWCEEHRIPYMAIPVGTVKKVATGKGNSKKGAMLSAAQDRWPEQSVQDDNHADALWIAEAALREIPAQPTPTRAIRSLFD